eukprot:4457783-Amphidinium_carterae.2
MTDEDTQAAAPQRASRTPQNLMGPPDLPARAAAARTHRVRFTCDTQVPCDWPLERALRVVREILYLRNCVLQQSEGTLLVQVSPQLARANAGVSPQQNVVQGGGRYHRVQHDAVAGAAQTAIAADLEGTPVKWDERLVSRMLAVDRKCTLACFQAKTRWQRMTALGAGFTRMGLPEYAEQAKAFARDKSGGSQDNSAEQIVGGGDVASETTARTRVRQRGSAVNLGMDDSEQTQSEVGRALNMLARRVQAMETWAHAMDSVTAADNAQSARSMVHARELLDVLAKKAIQDANSELTDEIVTQVRHNTARLNGMQMQSADQRALGAMRERTVLLEKDMAQWSKLLEEWRAEASMSINSLRDTLAHVNQLLSMHTQAVGQTWGWVASLVRVVQQRSGVDGTESYGRQTISATGGVPTSQDISDSMSPARHTADQFGVERGAASQVRDDGEGQEEAERIRLILADLVPEVGAQVTQPETDEHRRADGEVTEQVVAIVTGASDAQEREEADHCALVKEGGDQGAPDIQEDVMLSIASSDSE